jgi:hypothetical protein
MDIAIQAWLDQEDAHIGAMVRRCGLVYPMRRRQRNVRAAGMSLQ